MGCAFESLSLERKMKLRDCHGYKTGPTGKSADGPVPGERS
jgi:hypothetical protein